jgi:hypothetical protein
MGGWRVLAAAVVGAVALASTPVGSVAAQGADGGAAPAGRPLPDVEVTADDVAHVASLRAHLGLPADRGTVERLLSGADASVRWFPELFSLPLLPHEVAVAVGRQQLQDRATEIGHSARRALGDAYGGSWIEPGGPDGSGRFVVATADPAVPLPADVTADPAVAVVTVRYPLARLVAEIDGIERVLAAAGVDSGGIAVDERANELVVYVADVAAAARDPRLADVVSRPDVRLETGGGIADQVDKDDALIYLVVEGGQAIGPTSSPTCTSGYAVDGAYGPFILTAGHCGYVGQGWRQGGLVLGDVAADNQGGNFDGMLISTFGTRNNRGRLHITSADYYEPVGFVTPGDEIGFIVCNTGFGSTGMSGDLGPYTRCGDISSRTLDPGPAYNAVFRVADYRSLGGDSGAAIYRNTIYGISGEGVHKACFTTSTGACVSNPYRAIYSYLPYIRDHWGLTLSRT